MLNLPFFVGLDYHQKVIQVCVMNEDGKVLANQSVANDPAAVHRVVSRYGTNIRVAIEACNGAANFAEELILQYKWDVRLGHAGYVARMKQTPDKSDWADSKLLADLIRVKYLPRVWLPPENIRDLRDIVHHRHGLVEQRKQVKLRIRALLRHHRIECPYNPWTKPWKAWHLSDDSSVPANTQWILKQQFKQVEQFNEWVLDAEERIKVLVENDPVVKTLMQQPGVGLITAATMRACIGQFSRFSNGKQLAHFCATCPCNDSTGGKTTTSGLVKAGDELLRQVVIETAHRLIRYDAHWKAMAERLLAEGKKKCVVVAAVANRWVRKLYYTMTASESSIPSESSDNRDVGFLRNGQKSTLVIKCPSDAARESSDGIRKSGT